MAAINKTITDPIAAFRLCDGAVNPHTYEYAKEPKKLITNSEFCENGPFKKLEMRIKIVTAIIAKNPRGITDSHLKVFFICYTQLIKRLTSYRLNSVLAISPWV